MLVWTTLDIVPAASVDDLGWPLLRRGRYLHRLLIAGFNRLAGFDQHTATLMHVGEHRGEQTIRTSFNLCRTLPRVELFKYLSARRCCVGRITLVAPIAATSGCRILGGRDALSTRRCTAALLAARLVTVRGAIVERVVLTAGSRE